MSKYTTELRFICENYADMTDSAGYADVDEVISKSRTKVFDFDYPIFDNTYKPVLETKILEHYYTREICEETVGLWKLRLKAKMNEIMPYYNKLYESELIQFNPLYDADYHREGERSGEQDNTTTNNLNKTSAHTGIDSQAETFTTSGRDVQTNELEHGGRDTTTTEIENGGTDRRHSESEKGGSDVTTTANRDKYSQWNLYSDTPQGGIEGILGAENEPSLLDDGYLTNATHILHDGEGTVGNSTTNYGGTTESDETDTYGKTVDQESTTNYGKTTDETNTTVYGKTETKNGSMTYGSTNVTTDTGNVVFDGNSTEEYAEHVYGKMPGTSNSKLLKEFRETFLNIDLDIIKELRNLFFNLW